MRLRHLVRACAAGASLAIAVAAANPVLAHGDHEPGMAPPGPDARPEWKGDAPARPYPPQTIEPRVRDEWLAECRRRMADDGVGGAVIGGLVGGVAGNRIAGRYHRTAGTIAGAAVGAVAGMAIDKAEDQGRTRDRCETYLDDYYAYQAYYGGYAQPGYGHAASACCRQPALAPGEPECTETIEYVTEYVPAPKARRSIPRRPSKVVPDKRVKVN